MKQAKKSFSALNGRLSRNEMKNVIGGSLLRVVDDIGDGAGCSASGDFCGFDKDVEYKCCPGLKCNKTHEWCD